MQHPVLKQAKDALDELSDDPKARMQAEMREMALISYKLGLGAAREEGLEQGKVKGRAEGKVEGRAEGKAELLRKLLVFKFGALPEVVTTRLEHESEAQLDEWFEAAVSATRLEDILGNT
jgi:flagellar biosynthesis/type III secretory pathway protein FliH